MVPLDGKHGYVRHGGHIISTAPTIIDVIRGLTLSFPSSYATNREWTRVYYSIDLRIPSWIPGFVVNILNTQALTSVRAKA